MPQSHNLSSIWKPEWLISRGLSLLSGIGLLLVLQGCRPTEGTIRKGESVVITLSLEKGQFQAVTLEQRDSDLMMTLTSPTNKRLSVDYFDGTVGEEKLFWKAEETGAYKLAVSLTSDKEGLAGHYKLTISSPRTPTAQDDDRLEAQRLYAEAFQLYDDPAFTQKRDHVVKTYEDSIGKWRAAGEPALCAETFIRLGHVWFDQNKFEMSRTYYQQALQEAQTSADLRGQADALANIGAASDKLSKTWEDKQQARQFYDQALGLSRQAKDQRVEASTLSNLGRYSRRVGQYQAALDYYLQALDKMRALGNREHEGIVLANIGAAYRSLGLKAEAEAFYNEALTIQLELGDIANQALCHNGLGKVLDLLGDRTKEEKEKALQKFEKAVELGKESVDRDAFEHNLGTICYELGMTYKRLGDPDKALGLFNESLTHLQTAFDLGKDGERVHPTLTSLGLLAHARSQKQEARRYLEKALVISRQFKDDYQEAIVLAAQARIARDDHRLAEAKTRIEEALRIVDSVRVRITLPELRSSYTTAQRYFYDLYADILLLLRTQQPRKKTSASYHKVAWQQIELARMTALRESVDSLDILTPQGVAQTDVAKLRELRSAIMFIKTLPDSSKKLEELSKLTTRYQELDTQIARQISSAANHPLPVNPDRLPEIQAALKEDTLLLEYSLGEDRSYLWVITPTNFEVFTLPGQAQFESVARQIRDAIASRQGISAETHAASVKLSNWLLEPVASRLGDKKLLIVADRILDGIPFGALPEPTAASAAAQSDSRLLIKSHEIVYLPAAMTLLSLPGPRETSQASPLSIVIIADPVFDARHPEAAAYCKAGQPPVSSAGAETSWTDRMAEKLSPVPFRDPEKAAFREAVFGLLPSSSCHELFGFQAKLGNVLADKLASHRDVIFYTHGIFNEGEQGMTGLALSRLNEQCFVEEKYLLRLADIYNLKLSADMVTLIACNTARSQTVRGFGVGSIANGFMFAGAARVLGTLWDVDGKASLELATRFYQNRRNGEPAPKALRNAQLSFLNDDKPDWRLPYYWAGFVLMGEFN